MQPITLCPVYGYRSAELRPLSLQFSEVLLSDVTVVGLLSFVQFDLVSGDGFHEIHEVLAHHGSLELTWKKWNCINLSLNA